MPIAFFEPFFDNKTGIWKIVLPTAIPLSQCAKIVPNFSFPTKLKPINGSPNRTSLHILKLQKTVYCSNIFNDFQR
jgi:hypothetical protein